MRFYIARVCGEVVVRQSNREYRWASAARLKTSIGPHLLVSFSAHAARAEAFVARYKRTWGWVECTEYAAVKEVPERVAKQLRRTGALGQQAILVSEGIEL